MIWVLQQEFLLLRELGTSRSANVKTTISVASTTFPKMLLTITSLPSSNVRRPLGFSDMGACVLSSSEDDRLAPWSEENMNGRYDDS